MKDFLKLLKEDESYSFYHNSLCKKEVKIKSDKLVIVRLIDEDTNIDITASENTNLDIIEINYINNKSTINKKITCKKNSHINIVTINHSICDDCMINAKSVVEEGAYLNNMKLSICLGEAKEYTTSLLDYQNGQIDEYNVIINSSNKKQEYYLCAEHKAKKTASKMINYVICKNDSLVVVDTNGIVKRGAKGSNVSQKTKGLLLSKDSEISANPWLQIDEYDCLASHGAGIGSLDLEDLFYLMSRGLSQSESEKLIIGGFVNPIYAHITNEKIKKCVEDLVSKYL